MKRPLKNMLSVGGADVASRLLGFVATAYLGRVLGASSFGVMNMGLSVLGYALLCSSPGLQVIGTRDVAAGPSDPPRYASELLSLRLLLAAVVVACAAVLCLWIGGEAVQRLVIALFAVSALPAALSLDWFFQGRERLDVVSAGKVIMYLVYLAAVAVLVSLPGDVAWSAVAFFAGTVGSSLWMMIMFRRSVGPLRPAWTPSRWKSLLHDSLPLGVSSILAQTVINLPVLIVGFLLSTADTGRFSAAMKLVFFVLIIDRVFYALFLPAISRMSDDREASARMASLAVRIVLAVSVPVAVTGFAFAPQVITLVYGDGYGEAALPLQILLLYVVCTLANTVSMGVLVAQKQEREYLKVMGWGTAVIVVLCLVLTKPLGVAGTAASLSAGEAFMSVAFAAKLRIHLSVSPERLAFPALAAGVLMLVVYMLVRSAPVLLAVPAAIVVFGIVLFSSGGISRDDINYLRERLV